MFQVLEYIEQKTFNFIQGMILLEGKKTALCVYNRKVIVPVKKIQISTINEFLY